MRNRLHGLAGVRRRSSCVLGLALVTVSSVPLVGTQRSIEDQIVEAVSPLTGRYRDGATVLGYPDGGRLQVIREGSNQFICLADNPRQERFQVSCYHKDLEPFMARGRELRAQGKRGEERQRIRNSEIESGVIEMPERASTISFYGLGELNSRTGWPESVTVLQVLYLPYATAEETGLPARPRRNATYLMDAGTPRAHLMIPGGRRRFRPHESSRRRDGMKRHDSKRPHDPMRRR